MATRATIGKLNKSRLSGDTVSKIVLAFALISFAILGRLIDHPANFAPIAALAIFAGVIFPKKYALTLPLAAIIISDIFIGFHDLIFLTWGSFAAIALFSAYFVKRIDPGYLAISSVLASSFFFVVTNLGVWAQGILYPRNFEGLVSCFYNALPFFRNTLLGDLFYTFVTFGAYFLIYRYTLNKKGTLSLKSEVSTKSF